MSPLRERRGNPGSGTVSQARSGRCSCPGRMPCTACRPRRIRSRSTSPAIRSLLIGLAAEQILADPGWQLRHVHLQHDGSHRRRNIDRRQMNGCQLREMRGIGARLQQTHAQQRGRSLAMPQMHPQNLRAGLARLQAGLEPAEQNPQRLDEKRAFARLDWQRRARRRTGWPGGSPAAARHACREPRRAPRGARCRSCAPGHPAAGACTRRAA